MIIASLYPCPFDRQERHEMNAAIIADGRLYAYEEAKLTTVKNEGTVQLSERSLFMGFKELNVLPKDVDMWVFPRPSETIDLKALYLFFFWIMKAFSGPIDEFREWYETHVVYVPHHISHAALSILGSGYSETAFLTMDNGGDFGDTRNMIFGEYRQGEFSILKEADGTHTICSFHGFLTDALGFSGGNNGKVSGLAAYGQPNPELYKEFSKLIREEESELVFDRKRYSRSEVTLDKMDCSAYQRDKINRQYPSHTNIFNLAASYLPHTIAATGEAVLQDRFMSLLSDLKKKTKLKSLVLSGGLFQNVALNNCIMDSNIFERCYFTMAPSDGGLALGQVLYVENIKNKRPVETEISAFIGPSFSSSETKKVLDKFRLEYSSHSNIENIVSEKISEGGIVGLFQGKAEFGPRSLGARSILADPRRKDAKFRINQLLKKRDWFMPYAPSVLEEDIEEWVAKPVYSPYMQLAMKIRPEKAKLIPAAVHVDGTARFHVVRKSECPRYWEIIKAFKDKTGIGIVLNTSFNRHGIATISTPRQAVEHLLEGCIEYLAIDDYFIEFSKNRIAKAPEHKEKTEQEYLKETCLYYLKHVFKMGSEDHKRKYVEELSEAFHLPLTYEGKDLISMNGERLSYETLVPK